MSCPIHSMQMVNGHAEWNLQSLFSNIYSMGNIKQISPVTVLFWYNILS